MPWCVQHLLGVLGARKAGGSWRCPTAQPAQEKRQPPCFLVRIPAVGGAEACSWSRLSACPTGLAGQLGGPSRSAQVPRPTSRAGHARARLVGRPTRGPDGQSMPFGRISEGDSDRLPCTQNYRTARSLRRMCTMFVAACCSHLGRHVLSPGGHDDGHHPGGAM